MPELAVGTLCYYDSFTGLIKGKVTRIGRVHDFIEVDIRLTADRGPYKRGEIIKTTPNWALPREAVRRRNGVVKIGHYSVVE